MKLFHIVTCFLAGAIGVTLVGWVLSLTPFFVRAIVYSTIIAILVYGVLWFLDDEAISLLNISLRNYYALLIALGVAVLAGAIVLVGVLHA